MKIKNIFNEIEEAQSSVGFSNQEKAALYEKRLINYMKKKGFEIIRNGWPDLLAIKNKNNPSLRNAFGLEIKLPKSKLSKDQQRMHYWLKKMNFPIYVTTNEKNINKMKGIKC